MPFPGLGNVWQLVLKESALISVTGLVELLRQSQIGAGSTRQPFDFYITAAALYLLITSVSTILFQRAESHSLRGVRRAADGSRLHARDLLARCSRACR